jgi:hypothetical protein
MENGKWKMNVQICKCADVQIEIQDWVGKCANVQM